MKLRMVSALSILLFGSWVQAQTILSNVETRFEGSTFVTELKI